MALTKNLSKLSRNSRVQREAEATYSVVNQKGKKYIQINAYGSTERAHTNVISQTLQLDESVAKVLLGIIKNEYDLL